MVLKNIKKIFPAPLNLGIINAGLTFISSIFFTKILNSRAKRGPLFVTWLVTYDCNIACKFCATHSMKKRFPEAISLERAREIALEIVKARSFAVGFTGGEVLLWPHLFEVIKVFKSEELFADFEE